MSHDYKPGDPIEVQGDDGEWHPRVLDSNEQFVYVGEWAGKIFVGWSEKSKPFDVERQYVRPYTPTVEIPEGWTLMRSDELTESDQVYDPNMPDDPWAGIDEIINGYPVLVVARRSFDE